jgi:hypothetical protein
VDGRELKDTTDLRSGSLVPDGGHAFTVGEVDVVGQVEILELIRGSGRMLARGIPQHAKNLGFV